MLLSSGTARVCTAKPTVPRDAAEGPPLLQAFCWVSPALLHEERAVFPQGCSTCSTALLGQSLGHHQLLPTPCSWEPGPSLAVWAPGPCCVAGRVVMANLHPYPASSSVSSPPSQTSCSQSRVPAAAAQSRGWYPQKPAGPSPLSAQKVQLMLSLHIKSL